jgi:hypothetical protein
MPNFQSRDHMAHSKLSQLPWGNSSEPSAFGPRTTIAIIVGAFAIGMILFA